MRERNPRRYLLKGTGGVLFMGRVQHWIPDPSPNTNFKDKVYTLLLSFEISFDLNCIVLHGSDAIKDTQPILVLHATEGVIALY